MIARSSVSARGSASRQIREGRAGLTVHNIGHPGFHPSYLETPRVSLGKGGFQIDLSQTKGSQRTVPESYKTNRTMTP